MQQQSVPKSLGNFYLVGISFERTNTATRSLFAVNDAGYKAIARQAKKNFELECYILSTCNRTEIYGFAADATQLVHLLCRQTEGSPGQFMEYAYVLRGKEAIRHLYEVACGLRSQILGDYEVASQVKQAFRRAKASELLGSFTERLINSVLQVSKQVKNETRLSSGTVSVSFAVVKYLQQIPDIKNKNILLLGIGKIGRNTCKNLLNYLKPKNIVLINRTSKSAKAFARAQGLAYAPYEMLPTHLKQSDIILVATNAPSPILHKKDLYPRNQIILDLSIPQNVSQDVRTIPAVQVIDVDVLSQIQDHTLEARKKEIPAARAIIDEQMQDFLYWYQMRKHAFVLKAMKEKMTQIHHKEIRKQYRRTQTDVEELEALSSRIVKKMVNVFAGKLKEANGQADHYYQMLGEIFEIPVKD